MKQRALPAAALRLFSAALPLLVSSSLFAAPASPAYVEALIARAHVLHLAESAQWLQMGYWRESPLTGYESDAKGADFFLAKDGATNPAHELDATLRGIFGLLPLTPEEKKRELMPAYCRFPARTMVLQQQLHFDVRSLDVQPCPKLDAYWNKVQPESVSIIFSSYYLNNPASAFGHTFLRIRKRDPYASAAKRELLDSSVEYSADVDTKNPFAYALKGLFGLFPGSFSLKPYFYKVREYNDYESRDLWEYELNLTDSQVTLLAAHLFELGSTYIPYFYVDGNCSYYILAVLQVVAPDFHLLDQLKTPVIPADTIKALYVNPGLVKAVHYRPSLSTQFQARVQGMTGKERELIEALASDPNLALPGELSPLEQIRIFDAAADLVDIRYAKEIPFEPDGAGGRIKQRILERRAQILLPSPKLEVPQPKAMPHESHGSARLVAGFVDSDLRGPMISLGWRLALHSLEDPAGGYPDLAQIEFFPTELRIDTRSGVLRFEHLDFLKAISLHEMTSFDHRLSWKLRVGSERIYDGGCKGCLAASGTIGSGATAVLGPLTVFASGDATIQATPALDGIEGAHSVRALLGPAAGLRLRLGEHLTLLATGRYDWMPHAVGTWTWEADATLRWAPMRDFALGISARKFPGEQELGGDLFYYY